MAIITIEIEVLPDEKKVCVIDCFCTKYSYDESLGITKEEFFKEKLVEIARSAYVEVEIAGAKQIAAQEKLVEINAVTIQ